MKLIFFLCSEKKWKTNQHVFSLPHLFYDLLCFLFSSINPSWILCIVRAVNKEQQKQNEIEVS